LAYVSATLDSYWDTLKERRKFRRFEKQLAVECSVQEKVGDLYHAFSHDVSGEGVCLQVPEIMPEKSQINMQIKIPGKRPLDVKGEVVWVSEMKRDYTASERVFKVGVRFLKIDTKDKGVLNKYLDQIAKDSA